MIERKWFTAKRVGLAASILLMPGGFLLGGALLARTMNDRRKAKAKVEEESRA